MTGSRLAPGDIAPEFTLRDADGNPVSLSSYQGRRVIIYFYPAAMTRGCTVQACDFRDNLTSLQAAGYEVLGISPDAPAKLAEFRDRDSVTYPLLSDEDLATLNAYAAYGERERNGQLVPGVLRSTFVIDADGVIEKAMYNVLADGHVATLRRELGLDAA